MCKLFKKSISIITACLLACPLTANAVDKNIYGPQENGSYISNSNNIYTAEEINTSTVKPVLSLSKTEVDYTNAGQQVPVTLSVKGADKAWNCMGVHIYYDERLILETKTNGTINYSIGAAAEDIPFSVADSTDNGIFFTCSGEANLGRDGDIVTFYFTLPNNINPGDSFPIEIKYEYTILDDIIATDLFTNRIDNLSRDELMEAYVFTKGIENGYINVTGKIAATTTPITTTMIMHTTTAINTTTTTTTTPKPVTTTTTTTTTKPVTTTTTTSKPITTTPKPITTTTTPKPITTTPKPITTTTMATTTPAMTTTAPITTTLPSTPTLTLGNVNLDDDINALDASLALSIYAMRSTGREEEVNKLFSDIQLKNADVNNVDRINATDASLILAYYAHTSIGGKLTFEEFLKK